MVSFENTRRALGIGPVFCLLLLFSGCSSSSSSNQTEQASAGGGTPQIVTKAQDDDEPLPSATSPYDALPEEVRPLLDQTFTGDFDEMVKRRIVRAGVVYNRTQYFIDRGVQRGISYESVNLFEEQLNKRLKTGLLKVQVAIVPLARDQLFPALEAGKVDFVAAALTITPERRKVAEFSTPTRMGVSEIVVTAPDVMAPATVDDLSGREVFVRKSSSYYESLQTLNKSLAARGKPPVEIVEAPEALEDDDILEMVSAGLVDVTVVDDFVTEFWQQVFPDFKSHKGVAVRTGGEIAVGVRKNNPRMLRAVNQFVKEYGPNTAFGNMMERRYLESTKYVKGAGAERERQKLRQMVKFFQTYGSQVQRRLPVDGGAGVPGVSTGSVGKEPRGCDWRHAGDASDRQGPERRRHHESRAEHSCRREVLPLHDGRVLQGRTDDRARQGSDDARVLQRRTGTDKTATA